MLIFKGRNRVTQPYGGQHGGIDIVGDDDRQVRSVSAGTVEQISRWDGVSRTGTQSYGNLVIARDKAGKLQYYAHLAGISVREGQALLPGDVLGEMGNTGNSFGAHTHFEVRSGNRKKRYNPAEYLHIENRRGVYTSGKNGWVRAKESWYWYEDGEPVRSAWRKENGWWYYLGAEGKMLRGFQTIGGKRYVFCGSTKCGVPNGALIVTDQEGVIL